MVFAELFVSLAWIGAGLAVAVGVFGMAVRSLVTTMEDS